MSCNRFSYAIGILELRFNKEQIQNNCILTICFQKASKILKNDKKPCILLELYWVIVWGSPSLHPRP